MDAHELNAPPRARSRGRRPATRSGGRGVVHLRSRHHNRFTVVGDHLSQHAVLGLTAMGLGLHIMSLPDGANIGIKFLRLRFPHESEARIASALRQLETAGYLSRDRVRLPNGQIVTRTVFRDRPDAPLARQHPGPETAPPRPDTRPRPTRAPHAAVAVRPAARTRPARPAAAAALPPLWAGEDDAVPAEREQEHPYEPDPPHTPDPSRAPGPVRPPEPVRAPEPPHTPEPSPVPEPSTTPPPALAEHPAEHPAPPRRDPRPLPVPRTFDPERDQAARDLLAALREDDTRLTLADRDVHRLAPGVAAWLERQVAPDAVRRALTERLPDTPRNARALLAYRLAENMPGALPPAPVVVRPDPLQDCDGCGRVFRAPRPGACRDCRTEGPGGT